MERKLLQVKLSSKGFEDIECIKKLTGVSTMTEVVRSSLTLYRWLVEKRGEGYEIYAIGDDEILGKKIQIIFPS